MTLPPLKPVGAEVRWKLDQSPLGLVVADSSPAPVLDEKGQARIDYRTTQEDKETAKGTAVEGKLSVDIAIRRKEISDLQKVVADALFGQIPNLIAPFLVPILKPPVDKVLSEIAGLVDAHGYQAVVVTYHEPNTPTTTSTTTSGSASSTTQASSTIDACTVITEQDATAALGADPGPGKATIITTGVSQCVYGSDPAAVQVTVGSPTDRTGFDHGRAAAMQTSPSQVHDVSGVGDAAYRFFIELDFFKGHTTVGISLGKPGVDKLIALGQAAAARV